MTLSDAFEGHSLKTTQLMQKGLWLLLAVTASLILAFRPQNGIMLAVVLAMATLVGPAVYVVARRIVDKVRQRETEERLLLQTRTYLQNERPARPFAIPPAAAESDIEILARAIDGQRLPMQDFRSFAGIASLPRFGDPVVFGALARRYAIRSLYERRFANLAGSLPRPVALPLGDLLPECQDLAS
jgi:hypothetical protein